MLIQKTPITFAIALAVASAGFNASAFANGQDPSIEELKTLIRQQQQQLEALQRRVEQMEQTSVETQAKVETLKEVPPKVVTSGEERVSLTISGQVNRGALYTNDGEQDDWYFVDNDNSSTRIRAVGKAKVTDDVTIGTNFEAEFELNSSADVNQDNKTNASGKANFKGRKMELYVDSKKYGRGWMGHGSTATDGTAEEDLSGTSVIAYSGVADTAAGILFRSKDRDPETGDKPLTDITVGDAFLNLDGLGRDDRARYDTPNFNGFKASLGAVSSDRWNIAGRYAADFGSVAVAGAIGYATLTNNASFKNRWSGSVSGLHASGFNLTFAGGRDKGRRNRDDRKYWYVKGGYIAKLVSWGDTAFSIDYYDGKDMIVNGDKSKSWGVAAVQNLSQYGTEFYVTLRNYDYDPRLIIRTDDIFAGMVGARVKF